MRSQRDVLLYSLMLSLVSLRSPGSDSKAALWATYGRAQAFIDAAASLDLITHEQYLALHDLVSNAYQHSGKSFLDPRNLGPVMPNLIALQRRDEVAVKHSAQVLPNEPAKVSAPPSRRELRLLCLLVPARSNGVRSIPVGGMHPLPPRICSKGRWPMVSDTGLHLRQTHAVSPSSAVLASYSRHGQANAIRTG